MNIKTGPRCPGGADCENRVFLEEYEKVDREYERQLVRQCADLRVQVNRLEAELAELRDPEEQRDDGKVVRKDRWETGIRNISAALGWSGPQEVGDVVDAVKNLIASARCMSADGNEHERMP